MYSRYISFLVFDRTMYYFKYLNYQDQIYFVAKKDLFSDKIDLILKHAISVDIVHDSAENQK